MEYIVSSIIAGLVGMGMGIALMYLLRKSHIMKTARQHAPDRKHYEHIRPGIDQLFENSMDLLCVAGFDGYFKEVNPAWIKTLGWSKDELVAKPWLFFVHPDDQHATLEAGKKVQEGLPAIQFENRYRCKDGSYRWLSWNSFPITDTNLIYATVRDITERKNAELEIYQLTSILENTSDLVSTATPEGEILYMNTAGRNMLGWPEDDDLTTHQISDAHPQWAYEILHNEGLPETIEKGIWFGETAVYGKNGEEVPVSQVILSHKSDDGHLEYFSTIMRDISERKNFENEVQQRQNKLDSIFRAAPTGIGLVVNRVLTQVNDLICTMTGYSDEELIGNSARMLYPTQEDYEYVGQAKYEQIAEKGTGTVETHWKRKDGQIIDVLLSSTPLDINDLSKGVTFTALDITERKRTQEAMEKRILALTRPLDNTEDIHFEDLFNLDTIQHLQDLFAKATGVASLITDPKGDPITQPSNFCRLCSEIIL